MRNSVRRRFLSGNKLSKTNLLNNTGRGKTAGSNAKKNVKPFQGGDTNIINQTLYSGGLKVNSSKLIKVSNADNLPLNSRSKDIIQEKNNQPTIQLSCFASCLPGLETYLLAELQRLGLKGEISPSKLSCENGSLERGGVSFEANSISQILSCHLHLGIASHILLRAGPTFQALGMEELCRKVSKMPIWKQYISLPIDRWSPNTNNIVISKSRKNVMGDIINDSMLPLLDIRVVSTKSRLYHTKGISERVERGIWNALGLNGQAIIDAKNANEEMLYNEKKIIPILVRIHKDEVQISIDTSLTPLHNRGYRLETSKAPLREDIAYAMLFAAGWAQSKNMLGNHICGNVPPMRYLLDPFCGSGTIIIEGALMSLGIPPGFLRSSPFSSSSFFADCEKTWKDLVSTSVDNSLEQAEKNLFKDKLPKLLGSDRDMGAIEAAISNANRAGVSKFVQFHHSAISANPWIEQKESIHEKLLVATNPPFGVRVSHKNSSGNVNHLLPLYQTLGKELNSMNRDIDVIILAKDVLLARQSGLPNLRTHFTTRHGGLPVSALSTIS